MSKTKFHHIRITKSKVIHVQIPVPKWEKNEKVGKDFLDGAIKGLQIGVSFRDYRSGQEGVQIGAALRISSRGKKITNRGRDFKSVQAQWTHLRRFAIDSTKFV